MSDLKTTILVVNAKLKITIPASLNEAQQASITCDLVSDIAPTVHTGIIEAPLRSYMREVDYWSAKQLISASLWVDKADFYEESSKEPKEVESNIINSFFQEAEALNNARESLTRRMNAEFIPMADEMIKKGNINELKELIERMPSCPTRMTLAGKLQNALSNQ